MTAARDTADITTYEEMIDRLDLIAPGVGRNRETVEVTRDYLRRLGEDLDGLVRSMVQAHHIAQRDPALYPVALAASDARAAASGLNTAVEHMAAVIEELHVAVRHVKIRTGQ